jgi:hypothetical protein
MQVFNGIIKDGKEGITSAALFLSQNSVKENFMTENNTSTEFPLPKNPRFQNRTGKTFSLLTVVRLSHKQARCYIWLCRCECGNTALVSTDNLTRNHTRSCGCLPKKPIQHGDATTNKKTPEYTAYTNAKGRCQNVNHPDYLTYGGRGIEFRFESFEDFLTEVGRRPTAKHSIDRIDYNGHYEKGNLRWATRTEQNRNKRSNLLLTIGGETKSSTEWLEFYGSSNSPKLVWGRIHTCNWCAYCAVTIEDDSTCVHREWKRGKSPY